MHGGANEPLASLGFMAAPVTNLWWIAALTLVPWIELRGSIPLGIALGYPPLLVFAVCVAVNCLIVIPGFLLLDLFYQRWLSRVGWVRRQVDRVRARGARYVERYELLGLAIFVAIPLPGTGAYSGTLLAWLLGLDRRRAGLAVAAGVVVAGAAVTLAATGVVSLLRQR